MTHYDDVDIATKNNLEKTCTCNLQYIMPSLQKQQEVKDFDLIFTTILAHGRTIFKFDQSKMCHHLYACLE